ncbi:MAG: LysR family transcriptional regulator substrate-binding protein, partial [Mailhella sp.]
VVRAARKLREAYPRITFRIFSGNGEDVAERLERGLIDFGIFVEPFDLSRFDYVRLPVKETWGLLMKAESPLARHNDIHPEDIVPLPLIMSRQSMVQNMLSGWFGGRKEQLNIVSTYNLLYNASLMVEEGMGYALCLDGIISTSGERSLCFRPLEPKLEAGLSMAWKKYQVFSRSAELFLKYLKAEIRGVEMVDSKDKKIF